MPSLESHLEGRSYWMGLSHLANTPEFQERFEHEFSGYDPDEMRLGSGSDSGSDSAGGTMPAVTRRSFMKLMGAAMGLAGLTLSGCRRWPEQEIRPHAYQPEGFKPGMAVHYATMLELAGVATGILAKSYDGRPIKIEGNPAHPFSLGATEPWMQASVLDIYDPDRSRYPQQQVEGSSKQRSWADFTAWATGHFAGLSANQGQGLAVISEALSGPTFERLAEQFKQHFPQAKWVTWEPIHRDYSLTASQAAFGKPLREQYHLVKAKVIVCFEEDLLGQHPARLKYAREWAAGRQAADQGTMNRLYVVESQFSVTGAAADHRLPAKPSQTGAILEALAAQLGIGSATAAASLSDKQQKVLKAILGDLQANAGAGVVAVGQGLPAKYHLLGHAINAKLGNLGQTVTFVKETMPADSCEQLEKLSKAIEAGEVSTLVILGGNPVFTAGLKLEKVAQSIHLSHEFNETSAVCRWHLNRAHSLECWNDGCTWDGTVSLQQPLILPLFDGKSPIELLAMLMNSPVQAGYELVRETWQAKAGLLGGLDFEKRWRQALHDGVVVGSAWAGVSVSEPNLADLEKLPALVGTDLELVFVADTSVFDGRFANNGWLQEMPDPMTKLTWDNAVFMGKAQADKLGVSHGDMVTLNVGNRQMEVAVFIQPGIAEGAGILPLGYGRTVCGNVGKGVGFDSFSLRGHQGAYVAGASAAKVSGKKYVLATTQEHHLLDAIGVYGRQERVGKKGQSGFLIRESSLEEYAGDKQIFHRDEAGAVALPLYEKPHSFADPHAWAMTIDMNSCIGCNACVVACQAENNVPIVGKYEVTRNHEMHWLRIDRYFKGDIDDPQVIFTPLACVHCENAPCEQVCPVAATVHDAQGLNTMVYNRCIGTRYCSNNCPYKVRRFNYFDWHVRDPKISGDVTPPYLDIPDKQQSTIDQLKQMVYNPEVTVRMRGVMEKCTYCTQRIQAAQITAKLDHANGKRDSELVRDGDVVTACQQACPTQAIVFGNLNDPASRVSQLQKNNRAYAMLNQELNINPRTHHLAKIRHPESTLSS